MRVWLALTLLLLPWNMARAERSEAEIKAAFIYNFAKFIEWPQQATANTAPLQLCTLLDKPATHKLNLLQGREAQGREIQIKALGLNDSPAQCHMLYIALANKQQSRRLLKALNNAPILTISDSPGFAEMGGMIGLYIEAERLQFAVNLPVTQQAGLKLSARLLQMAHIVPTAPLAGGQP